MLTFPITGRVVPSGYPLDYAWGMAVVALLYLAPLGASWRLLRRLAGDSLPAWLRLPLALTLAPLLLALPLFAAGLAGLLYTPVVIALLLAFLPFYRGLRSDFAAAWRELISLARQKSAASPWFSRIILAAILVLVLFSLIRAMSPVNDGDCIQNRGHLALAVSYAESGAMPIAKWNINFGAPHLHHMLLTAIYLLRAPAAPPYIPLSQFILLALLVGAFTAWWWGPEAGLTAMLLILGGGDALTWSHIPRTDISVALPGAISIFLWAAWLKKPTRGLLLAASLFAGLAAAVKISWWLFLPLQALFFLIAGGKVPLLTRLGRALLFLILPALLVVPWLIRSQLLTGTPVYPLTWHYTGGKYWDKESDDIIRAWEHDWCTYENPTLSVAPLRVPARLAASLRADLTLALVVLFALMALLLRRTLGGPVWPLFAGGLLYFLAIVGFLDSDPRHYLTATAIFAALAGGAVSRFIRGNFLKPLKFALLPLILLAVFFGHGEKPKVLPEFGMIFNHGPKHIAYRVYPYSKAQLWVDYETSPKAAAFLSGPVDFLWHNHFSTGGKVLKVEPVVSFYLRRTMYSFEDLASLPPSPENYSAALAKKNVEYIVIEKLDGGEPKNPYLGNWRFAHSQGDKIIFPMRQAIWALVQNPADWQLVYEKMNWQVYKKLSPAAKRKPHPLP